MKKRSAVVTVIIVLFLNLVVISGSSVASNSMLESMKDSVRGIKILLMAADFESQDLSWMMNTGQDPDWGYLAKLDFIIPVVDREYDASPGGIHPENYQIYLFAFGESEWDILFYSKAGLVSVVARQIVEISTKMIPVGGHYVLNLGSDLNANEISARVSFSLGGEETNRQLYFWEEPGGELKANVFIPYAGTDVSLGISSGKRYWENALNWQDAVDGVISIIPNSLEGGDLKFNIIWPSE